ncbi:hypothetical protein BDV10DRAFT_25349 [Aspergillus recurvatus]
MAVCTSPRAQRPATLQGPVVTYLAARVTSTVNGQPRWIIASTVEVARSEAFTERRVRASRLKTREHNTNILICAAAKTDPSKRKEKANLKSQTACQPPDARQLALSASSPACVPTPRRQMCQSIR